MKRISKISLFEEEFDVARKLSEIEMRGVVGGTDGKGNSYGVSGFCYYDCMAYMADYLGYSGSMDSGYFAFDYVTGRGDKNDDWEGTQNIEDVSKGPLILKDGAFTGEPFAFLSNYFETSGSGWAEGEKIQSLFDKYDEKENCIMGFYKSGADEAHAIILKSYTADTDGGYYSYYDPSTFKEGSVKASDMLGASKVSALPGSR